MERSIVVYLFVLTVKWIQCGATPLDDYVNKPDPTYRYDVIGKLRGPTYTLYTVNMTSQTWKPGEKRAICCAVVFVLNLLFKRERY